jgi:hypothetical protein
MTNLSLAFEDPFSFAEGENGVFHSKFAESPGIYLWTIKQSVDASHLIHYIGETTSLRERHREHLTQIHWSQLRFFDVDTLYIRLNVCVHFWN